MGSRRRRIYSLAAELTGDVSERQAYEGFCARLCAETRRRGPAESARVRRELRRTWEGRGLDVKRLARCGRTEGDNGRQAQG